MRGPFVPASDGLPIVTVATGHGGWRHRPVPSIWSIWSVPSVSSLSSMPHFRGSWPPGDPCPFPRSAAAQLRPRGLPPGPDPGGSKRLRQAAPTGASTPWSL